MVENSNLKSALLSDCLSIMKMLSKTWPTMIDGWESDFELFFYFCSTTTTNNFKKIDRIYVEFALLTCES